MQTMTPKTEALCAVEVLVGGLDSTPPKASTRVSLAFF